MLVLALGITVMLKWEEGVGIFSGENADEDAETIKYNGADYVLRDDIETFLVMGLDKFEGDADEDSYNNNMQADFLMLLVFDKAEKSYKALHLNRDTMVEMQVLGVTGDVIDTREGQVALSYTYGSGGKDSCVNTRNAVTDFLMDIHIDGYISMKMDAVSIINDAVGGVTVTVNDDFSGIDDTLVMGQEVTLKGEQALTYVRSRGGLEDSSNEQRMKRQQQYLEALRVKIDERSEDTEFIADVLVDINDYLVSDCSASRLESFFDAVADYDFNGVQELEGEIQIGEFKEFYADGESVLKTVTELFCEPK